MNVLKRVTESLLHLFYPNVCNYCQRPLAQEETVLCLHCILILPRTQFHLYKENKATQIFIGRVPVETAVSFVYFTKDGMMQDLLHQFKYNGKKEIGTILGKLFAEDIKDCSWLKEIDVIVPVPLHKKKERLRGFNQATVFARSLGQALNIPLLENVLQRRKYTESQTNKSRKTRMINMEGVFEVMESGALIDKYILLVDDVLTTGATLESCALECKKVSGTKISIATIAIAGE